MANFREVWDELEVKDDLIRFTFKLNGYKFWIDKSKGLMRRLVGAERLLRMSVIDPDGIASGEYDSLIDPMMILVSQRLEEENDKIDFDSEWREKIVGKMPEDIQIDMLLNLPYSVAAVILGETRAAMALGEGLTSQDSINQEAAGQSSD